MKVGPEMFDFDSQRPGNQNFCNVGPVIYHTLFNLAERRKYEIDIHVQASKYKITVRRTRKT